MPVLHTLRHPAHTLESSIDSLPDDSNRLLLLLCVSVCVCKSAQALIASSVQKDRPAGAMHYCRTVPATQAMCVCVHKKSTPLTPSMNILQVAATSVARTSIWKILNFVRISVRIKSSAIKISDYYYTSSVFKDTSTYGWPCWNFETYTL